jgi:ribosome-associated heat shock protein Hsp15
MQRECASEIRLDKWLWAVRLYKTRSLAAAACAAGHVRIGGQRVKPARGVRVGEIIEARVADVNRTVKVIGLLSQRVGAKVAAHFVEELTPASELHKPRAAGLEPLFHRPKGAGRPTKRDRRLLEKLSGAPPAG